MKKLTKLALATSVAFSANAMAMQAMDDASLSATTGQDGLSIGIGISRVEIGKVFIHDNDGLADTALGGTGEAGAIYIKANGSGQTATHGVVIGANYDNGGAYLLASRNLADLTIDSDAGDGNPFINIAAEVSGLDINIGEIGVVASAVQGVDNTADGGEDNTDTLRRGGKGVENAILTGLSVKTGPMSANIQLGAAPQGAMIKLNATMIGGLTIENLGIVDNSTKQGTGDGSTGNRAAGVLHLDKIQVADAGQLDLALDQSISIFGTDAANTTYPDGYIRIVSTSGAHDNYVTGVRLGSATAASIGDVEIQGMQTYYGAPVALGGTGYQQGAIITIAGH